MNLLDFGIRIGKKETKDKGKTKNKLNILAYAVIVIFFLLGLGSFALFPKATVPEEKREVTTTAATTTTIATTQTTNSDSVTIAMSQISSMMPIAIIGSILITGLFEIVSRVRRN